MLLHEVYLFKFSLEGNSGDGVPGGSGEHEGVLEVEFLRRLDVDVGVGVDGGVEEGLEDAELLELFLVAGEVGRVDVAETVGEDAPQPLLVVGLPHVVVDQTLHDRLVRLHMHHFLK